MNVLLLQPPWHLDTSRYTTVNIDRAPVPPLELLYLAAALRERHDVALVDSRLERLEWQDLRARVAALEPDVAVVTTAPGYLFWRCPPLQMDIVTVTAELLHDLGVPALLVGPHGTVTPGEALTTTRASGVFAGEPEVEVARLLDMAVPTLGAGQLWRCPPPDLAKLVGPAFEFALPTEYPRVQVSSPQPLVGAVAEASRGCPSRCIYCLRTGFRSRFRFRRLEDIVMDLQRLLDLGANYVYFIDESFELTVAAVPGILDALRELPLLFGCQLCLDRTDVPTLRALANAGFVRVEAGVDTLEPALAGGATRPINDPDELRKRVDVLRELDPSFDLEGTLLDYDAIEYKRWFRSTRRALDRRPYKVIRPYPGTRIERLWDTIWPPDPDQRWPMALARTRWLLLCRHLEDRGAPRPDHARYWSAPPAEAAALLEADLINVRAWEPRRRPCCA